MTPTLTSCGMGFLPPNISVRLESVSEAVKSVSGTTEENMASQRSIFENTSFMKNPRTVAIEPKHSFFKAAHNSLSYYLSVSI